TAQGRTSSTGSRQRSGSALPSSQQEPSPPTQSLASDKRPAAPPLLSTRPEPLPTAGRQPATGRLPPCNSTSQYALSARACPPFPRARPRLGVLTTEVRDAADWRLGSE